MTRSAGLWSAACTALESLLLSELLIYQKKKLRIKWTHDPFWTCSSCQTLNMFVSFVYPLCLFSTKWSLKLNRKQLCRQQCQHAHLRFGFSACRSQGSCFVQLCFPLRTVIFCDVWTRHQPSQTDNYQKHVTDARTDWQEKCRCLLPCLFSNCTDMKDLCSDPWTQKYPETDSLKCTMHTPGVQHVNTRVYTQMHTKLVSNHTSVQLFITDVTVSLSSHFRFAVWLSQTPTLRLCLNLKE